MNFKVLPAGRRVAWPEAWLKFKFEGIFSNLFWSMSLRVLCLMTVGWLFGILFYLMLVMFGNILL